MSIEVHEGAVETVETARQRVSRRIPRRPALPSNSFLLTNARGCQFNQSLTWKNTISEGYQNAVDATVGRIDPQRHELFQPLEPVAKHVPHAVHRAEQVAQHGEAAAHHLLEQQR